MLFKKKCLHIEGSRSGFWHFEVGDDLTFFRLDWVVIKHVKHAMN